MAESLWLYNHCIYKRQHCSYNNAKLILLSIMVLYSCKLCPTSYRTRSSAVYVNHSRILSNQWYIPCGVEGCLSNFRSYGAFHSHISRDYSDGTRTRGTHKYLKNVGVTVRCTVPTCEEKGDFVNFIKHLNVHILNGIKIKCPAKGCGKQMNKRSTFSAHVTFHYGME